MQLQREREETPDPFHPLMPSMGQPHWQPERKQEAQKPQEPVSQSTARAAARAPEDASERITKQAGAVVALSTLLPDGTGLPT